MRRHALRLLIVVALAGVAAIAVTAGSTSSGQDAGRPFATSEAETKRCFGAASRDPERPCFNRELKLTVVPTPEEAKTGFNSPCTPTGRTEELYPCVFGTPPEQAVKTIALVGDSHAGHWRAGLDVAARERRWHGISLTQTGCPVTKATPILRDEQRQDCVEFNEALIPWLERHPQVSTVFTAQHGGKVVTKPGQSQYRAQIEGFRKAFEAMPPSVEQVVVIRGTPWSSSRSPACIEAAVAAGKRPDQACALPRKKALHPDLAAVAATLMRSERARVVDLTPFMCGPQRCFPVVGGALVHKDNGHITQVWSRSMGPYLGRYIDRVLPPG